MNFDKNYSLYFHNDFDGIASGAVILNFLRANGGDIVKFNFVKHPTDRELWASLKFEDPSIIVDFFYHPDAKIWFDHHETTFIKDEWKKNFKEDNLHKLEISPSTCGVIMNHLKNNFSFEPSPFIKDLVLWADKIDSAGFSSPREAFDGSIPAIRIMNSSDRKPTLDYWIFLIRELSQKSLGQVADSEKVMEINKSYEKELKEKIDYFNKNSSIDKNVCYLDATASGLDYHFITYFLRPEVKATVILKKRGKIIRLHADLNPWATFEGKEKINLGSFLEKNFGGGGHAVVAGGAFNTKEEAVKAAQKTVEYLNNQIK